LRNILRNYWRECALTSPPARLSYLGDLRPAFVANFALRLSDAICVETQAHADRLGILAPSRTHSAILFLHRRGPATLSEIARIDGQSHQLVASRLAPLEQLGLIERSDDPADRRRKPYRLTRTGRLDAKRVEAATVLEAEAMRRLFVDMDQDLIAVLETAIEQLRVKPLSRRIEEVMAAEAESDRNAAPAHV
jgi:DNA-binding MarR family transcriptional regulator